MFVAYAREPVPIDILALAISVRDHNQSLDGLRSSISTEKIILDTCGNLFSIDIVDSQSLGGSISTKKMLLGIYL